MTQKTMIIEGTAEQMALIATELHALRRLFAFTFAFLFWFSLLILLFALYLLRIIRLDQVLSLHQFLSAIGISYIVLAVATWKLIEKLLDLYVRRFLKKYVRIS